MRVNRRGKASRTTPTPGGDGRDNKVHHLVPDLADPADGRVAFRGRCPRLRIAATLLSCMTARARAGQLFLLGVPANALGGVEQQITADGPAGVFLTGHATVGTAALARQTAELQRVATAASGGSGLFLATDQRAAKSRS